MIKSELLTILMGIDIISRIQISLGTTIPFSQSFSINFYFLNPIRQRSF